MNYNTKIASKSIKEYIMEQLSEEVGIEMDIIAKVIAFQGDDVLENMKLVDDVEISGFGNFFISKNKARGRIRKQKAWIRKEVEKAAVNETYIPRTGNIEENIQYLQAVIERIEEKEALKIK